MLRFASEMQAFSRRLVDYTRCFVICTSLVTGFVTNAYGDVTAAIDGSGNLTVTGDAAADDVMLLDNSEGGLKVFGVNGTVLNGVVNGDFSTGTTAVVDVTVDLNSGNDIVTAFISSQSGNVDIATGNGLDQVNIDRSVISGILLITAGSSRDVITLNRSACLSDVCLFGEAGPDRLNVRQSSIFGNTVLEAGAAAGMGPVPGKECVNIVNSDFFGTLMVTTGDGPDTVVVERSVMDGLAKFVTNDGDDGLRVEQSVIEGQTQVDLGAGNDQVISAFTEHIRATVVRGRTGNDVIAKLGSVFEGNVTVLAGGGADRILTVGASFGYGAPDTVKVLGQGGNDMVFALVNIFDADLILNGGGGFDDLAGDPNVINGSETTTSFEGMTPLDWVTIIDILLDIDC